MSVGRDLKIVSSSVECCVVLENASIIGVERLEESSIRRDAMIVKGGSRRFARLDVRTALKKPLSRARRRLNESADPLRKLKRSLSTLFPVRGEG